MNKFWIALAAFFLTLTWARADIKISQLPSGTASPVTTYDVFPYSVISPTPTNPTAPVTLKMRLWDLANLFPFVSTYAPIASPTFTGTVSLPSSATTGFCWVATNSSGAGHWATCLGSLPTPITVNLGGTGATSFTSGLPLLGAGTSAFTTGTLSGNTTEFGTVSGSLTNGHCASFDASGNIVDSGDSCPLGGLGTVTTISVPFPLSVANATTTPAVTWSPFPVSYFLADGPAGAPSPRPIVSADLPTVLNSVTSASSLATVGTIGTGTWQGTKVGYAYGGTNATTQAAAQANMSPMTTAGDLTVGGVSGAPTRLAAVAVGETLVSTGVSAAPIWSPLPSGGGTVTSVSVPYPLAVANSTTTPTVTWSPYPTHYFLADGPAGAPSPRPIVSADLPTALNSITSASSLATVGTIGTGTWQGTTIAIAYGGIGQVGGAVTSKNTGGNYRIDSAQLEQDQGSSTVISSTGGWITFGSYSSPKTTWTITTGEFSATPFCVCTTNYSGASALIAGIFTCQIQALSNTSITLITTSEAPAEAAAPTFYAELVCMGAQ